jgi:hypothetical protein
MRNTPGNIIQFPESTLLVDIQRVTVQTINVDENNWYGFTDVGLETGYIYHLTNGAVLVPAVFAPPGGARGYVQVTISRREGSSYRWIALVGDEWAYPALSWAFAKSQTLDLWLWGDVRFEVGVGSDYPDFHPPRYDLFLVKYRR